jgi:hypothetical protein
VLITLIGIIPMPDYCRVEGVVEPENLTVVHAVSNGFIRTYTPTETTVTAGNDDLIKSDNFQLQAKKKMLIAELSALETKKRIAETSQIAAAQIFTEQIKATMEKIDRVEYELNSLNLKPPRSGTWVSPGIEKSRGMYLRKGEQIGFIAELNDVYIRATAGQNLAALLIDQAQDRLEMRPKGRPDMHFEGTIRKISPTGRENLPSQAMGYAAGGSMATNLQDPYGRKTVEHFYEIEIKPDATDQIRLLTGQRIVARIQLKSKPLIAQWYLSARQLFLRRFNI